MLAQCDAQEFQVQEGFLFEAQVVPWHDFITSQAASGKTVEG